MASILGTQSGIYQPPRQRALDANAQNADASGAVPAGPGGGDAPRGADTAAQAAAPATLDPTQVRSRIAGLIDGQVASGGLTGEQARVLKQVLGTGAASADEAGAAAASTTDSASLGQAAERQKPSEMLATFIRQLQTAQSRTGGYASDGSSGGGRLTSSRLLDFNT